MPVKQVLCGQVFHDLSHIEHHGVVRVEARLVQVVRDQKARLLPVFQVPDRSRDETLGHGVQGRCGLVQDDHIRVQDKGHGDERPLDLSAAEFMGVAVRVFGGKSHPAKAFLRFDLRGLAVRPGPLDQRFRHLVDQAIHGIQVRRAVLKHHGRLGSI